MEKNGHILWLAFRVKWLKWISAATLIVLSWLPGPAAALDPPVSPGWTTEQILSHASESQQKLNTFSASFKQTQTNALLLEPLVSSGTMFYRKTGELLMKITFPEPFVLLIKDGSMIMGDPVTKRYRTRSIPGGNALLTRTFGVGQTVEALKERYDIRSVNHDMQSACTLILVPRHPDRRMPFRSIQVRFDSRKWLPTGIRLEEANDGHTEIEWSYLTVNQPLPDDLFVIDIPREEMNDPFEPH